MTATQTTVLEQIQAVDERVHVRVLRALERLIETTLLVENPTNRWDYAEALCDLEDDLGLHAPRYSAVFGARPESSDSRPLYQRLDDEDEASRPTQLTLTSFAILEAVLREKDEALGETFYKAIERFEVALGLPSPEEYEANPEFYGEVNYSNPLLVMLGIVGTPADPRAA